MGTLISLPSISSIVSSLKLKTEHLLLAQLPNKKEVKKPLLLTHRQPKSEKSDWPNKPSLRGKESNHELQSKYC